MESNLGGLDVLGLAALPSNPTNPTQGKANVGTFYCSSLMIDHQVRLVQIRGRGRGNTSAITKWVLSTSWCYKPALTTVSALSRVHSGPLPSLSSPLGPVVNLGYAAFAGNDTSPEGEVHTSVTFYGGIPFTQPPAGNLRFRAMKRLDETIRDPPPCLDIRWKELGRILHPADRADCLTLNVTEALECVGGKQTPHSRIFPLATRSCYVQSPFGFPFYHRVAQNQGFIAVSIAYCLNLLGFRGGAAVAADGDMNAGFHDQVLPWSGSRGIYIGSFGGGPDEVTIAGESADGGSILAQMMAYGGSKPMHFKRGSVQSGAFGLCPTTEQAEATFKNVASIAGCTESNAEIMKCPCNASVGALASAINKGSYPPLIEGLCDFLPGLPTHLLHSGKFKKVDFMCGHTTDDVYVLATAAPEAFQSEEVGQGVQSCTVQLPHALDSFRVLNEANCYRKGDDEMMNTTNMSMVSVPQEEIK
ncbi:alpha/beta-hydrolase [Pleurotus eryngii]|uniref:Alpha/beta-hydrolase n=1 Tax=Pleurotus eryngii TaxID=5323 RepID=A0A9P6D9C7_PLEER|nr:alpha/beta-hydrolase [Pleurotus eryngii]